jgi:RNA polymerase sigma-70 factor (ECF subfamily)
VGRPFARVAGAAPAESLAADDHAAHFAHLRAAAVDPARFAPLYRRYVADVYYFCLRRLDDHEDAADATSRTFAKALAGVANFRTEPGIAASTFRAWLFRIAHTTVADMQRRQRPHDSLDADDASSPLPYPGMTPEEQALANEDRRRVRQVLHALPDRQRQIVELRLADLSGQEIADAMGISLSAMKSAQFRAFQTLRTLLADDDNPTQRSTTR